TQSQAARQAEEAKYTAALQVEEAKYKAALQVEEAKYKAALQSAEAQSQAALQSAETQSQAALRAVEAQHQVALAEAIGLRQALAELAARNPQPAHDAGLAIRLKATTYYMRRRSEEHTSELQSQSNLVCRLL